MSFFLLIEIYLGIGYFNRHGPEIVYFHSKMDPEVTFGTALQNRKPQMPSSVMQNAYVESWSQDLNF